MQENKNNKKFSEELFFSKLFSKSLYDRRSVDQSVLVSSPIWGSRPDINNHLLSFDTTRTA
jgi:hypothetical protein